MMMKRIVIAIGIVIALIVVAFFALRPFPRAFDSNTWKTCTNHSIRYAMHEDFLKRYHVVGMTKEQLIELLGRPDSESKTELSWDLGQYFGADDSAIDFKMKDGKVASVDVWGH